MIVPGGGTAQQTQLTGGFGLRLFLRDRGQFALDEFIVRLGLGSRLLRAPVSGHQEDERQEHDLCGQADPPPAFPLLRRICLRSLYFLGVRGQIDLIIGRMK